MIESGGHPVCGVRDGSLGANKYGRIVFSMRFSFWQRGLFMRRILALLMALFLTLGTAAPGTVWAEAAPAATTAAPQERATEETTEAAEPAPSAATEETTAPAPTETTELTTEAATEEAAAPETEETLPSEDPTEPEEPKTLWDSIKELFGFSQDPGPLEQLQLFNEKGEELYLDPSFDPSCYRYEAKVPIQGFRIEVTAYPGVAVSIGGDLLEDGEKTVVPEWSEEKEATVAIHLAADGWEGEDYVLHLTQLPPEPVELEITQMPDKTDYLAGESFDLTGMKVTVRYSDGSTRDAEPEELSYQPQGALTEDDILVTVFWGDLFQDLEITVRGILPGDGTRESPYLLATEADLRMLDTWVTEGDSRAEKAFFRMENDILLTGEWDGIGDEDTPFTGDFDGDGYQITIPEGGKALFARTRGAVIHDLKLYGPKIRDYGLVSHYVVDRKEEYYAQFYRVTLVSGTQTLYSGFLGGYASGQDLVLIEDCTVESGVTIGYDGNQSHIGSFAGEFNGYVRNSESAATVSGTTWVGGLVGNKGQSMGDFEVTDSSFSGSVTGSGNYVGGIVGGGYAGTNWGIETAPNAKGVIIKGCTCTGSVSGGNGVGGIFGADDCVQQFWDNGVGYIQNNRFTGSVSGSGSYVGGIIGFMQSLNVNMVISGNYYENAENGIGAVAHVDTSAVENGFRDGTYYYNTSKYVPDGAGGVSSYEDQINTVALKQYIGLPIIGKAATGQNRAVSKPNMNREDDPLGADKDKLCYTENAAPTNYVTGLRLEGTCKTEYTQGEALNLNGLTLVAQWSNGSQTKLSPDQATVSGYDANTVGQQTVRLRYEGQEVRLTVTVKPKSTDITVSVTILGDSHHSDPTANGGPHGLARGGLTTWAKETVTAKTTNTVWDVLQKVAANAGLRMDASSNNQYGTVYISGVNGLSEFDNGKNSGWMYTVNGKHPEVGVSARYLKDGDEIIFHYTDDYTYEEGSDKYNTGTTENAGNAQKVISLISAIGTVTATEECRQKIDAARKAYDALSDTEKKKVSNYSVLQAAELKYQELQSAGTQEQVKNVEDLIAKIGTVTASSGPAIQAARKAYDALTPAQQKMVGNLKTLEAAEKAYADLTATPEDREKAQAVMDMIKALGKITLDSEKEIQAAREAFDALTDIQRLLVGNLDVLETAEAELSMLKTLGKVSEPYISTGDYMEKLGTPSVGPIGGEWMVIGLARSGRTVPGEEDYYQKALEYIKGSIDQETGRLHKAKSTDNSRMILALTAIGKNAMDIDGINLLQGLSDMDFVKYQGNNGPIWALLALDCGNYPAPEGGTTTRQALIDEILSVQTSDGGWAITGDKADSDMTGMALTALAPYYESDDLVRAAVDKAVARLSEMQDADGGFSTSYGDGNMVATSESISQVVTALSALGINADTDERFIKNGSSAIDALLRYEVSGGGFKHVMDGKIDGMGTEQAYYALTAYYRLLSGKTSLYDMTDVIDMGGDPVVEAVEAPTEPVSTEKPAAAATGNGFNCPWWVLAFCMFGGCGWGVAITLIVLVIKKK